MAISAEDVVKTIDTAFGGDLQKFAAALQVLLPAAELLPLDGAEQKLNKMIQEARDQFETDSRPLRDELNSMGDQRDAKIAELQTQLSAIQAQRTALRDALAPK